MSKENDKDFELNPQHITLLEGANLGSDDLPKELSERIDVYWVKVDGVRDGADEDQITELNTLDVELTAEVKTFIQTKEAADAQEVQDKLDADNKATEEAAAKKAEEEAAAIAAAGGGDDEAAKKAAEDKAAAEAKATEEAAAKKAEEAAAAIAAAGGGDAPVAKKSKGAFRTLFGQGRS